MWIKGKYIGLVEIDFGFDEPNAERARRVKSNIPEFKRIFGEQVEEDFRRSIAVKHGSATLTTKNVELSVLERETP